MKKVSSQRSIWPDDISAIVWSEDQRAMPDDISAMIWEE